MGDRSNGGGGVRNIRAMFEAKTESTSPPSRGRSPAGSEGVRSSSSRPISKVRASFVAVEKSGQMGPIIGLRRLSDSVESSGGAPESKPNGLSQEAHTKVDVGASTNVGRDVDSSSALPNVKEEEVVADQGKENKGESRPEIGGAATSPSRNSTELDSSKTLMQSPTNETRSNGAAKTSSGDLGIVLKGSPFEPVPENSPANPSSNEGASKEPASSEKQREATPKNSSIRETQPKTNGKAIPSRKDGELKTATARPTGVSTKDPPGTYKTSPSLKSAKAIKSPTTPKDVAENSVTSTKQRAAKVNSPRPDGGLKDAEKASVKESSKVSAKHTTKQSLVTQSASGRASNPNSPTGTTSKKTPTSTKTRSTSVASNPTKKNTQPSPSTFHKPTPKSPTRPLRLPGSATAPTASSAAKIDAGQPSGSAAADKLKRKPSTLKSRLNTSNKGSATGVRPKSSRPSLNTAPERSTSQASSKPPDEGFLARMMRPTASSASKVHDKLVETKSPPRKPTLAKQKRKSEPADGKEGTEDGLVAESIDRNEKEVESEEASNENAPAPEAVTAQE